MCRGHHDPVFQASRRSLTYQFTLKVPLLCPLFHFQFLENSAFSVVWAKISALKTQLFQIFVPMTPHFLKENPLPRP